MQKSTAGILFLETHVMIDPKSEIAESYGESYILNNYNKYNMRTVCIKEIGVVGWKKRKKNWAYITKACFQINFDLFRRILQDFLEFSKIC